MNFGIINIEFFLHYYDIHVVVFYVENVLIINFTIFSRHGV